MRATKDRDKRRARTRLVFPPTAKPLDAETYIFCPPPCQPEMYCTTVCVCHGSMYDPPCDTFIEDCPTRCELCTAYE